MHSPCLCLIEDLSITTSSLRAWEYQLLTSWSESPRLLHRSPTPIPGRTPILGNQVCSAIFVANKGSLCQKLISTTTYEHASPMKRKQYVTLRCAQQTRRACPPKIPFAANFCVLIARHRVSRFLRESKPLEKGVRSVKPYRIGNSQNRSSKLEAYKMFEQAIDDFNVTFIQCLCCFTLRLASLDGCLGQLAVLIFVTASKSYPLVLFLIAAVIARG